MDTPQTPPPARAPHTPSGPSAIRHDAVDRVLMSVDAALRTVFADHAAARPYPRPAASDAASPLEGPGAGQVPAGDGFAAGLNQASNEVLTEGQKREAAALMRVNHVGEVCAQALYASQAWGTRDPALKATFEAAAREETDHLAWTEQRLRELGGRTSLLNPLWYAGAFGIGLLAARAGDKISLGFVVETERQVEQHLNSHMDRLPAGDLASRAIVAQMRDDEVAHADAALAAGGVTLPAPVRGLMRLVAKIMTTTAHHI